jgi:cell division septation protein DedD
MSFTLPGVQDAIIAISTVVGVAILFALALIAASALVQRDKARHAKTPVAATTTPSFAQQPTEMDRIPELVGR